jgi:16S rRNA (adenine(1408)-N(1))-methyltransferase
VAPDSTNSIDPTLKNSSHNTGGGVIVDIGTGDGRFVLEAAKRRTDRLYIGIDSATSALEKPSEKIHRKPAKGGLKNALFVQASVEDLPEELNGIADEVHIHFPWGSLLQAVINGETTVLSGIRRICSPGALMEIVTSIDEGRDGSEISRLQLELLSENYVRDTLKKRYDTAGFSIKEYGTIGGADWPDICTSWSQRLKFSGTRSLTYLIAEAI